MCSLFKLVNGQLNPDTIINLILQVLTLCTWLCVLHILYYNVKEQWLSRHDPVQYSQRHNLVSDWSRHMFVFSPLSRGTNKFWVFCVTMKNHANCNIFKKATLITITLLLSTETITKITIFHNFTEFQAHFQCNKNKSPTF